jgi:hypothetical protein
VSLPLPIALAAQLQAELQAVKSEQEAMLWEFTTMMLMPTYTTAHKGPEASSRH